MVVVAVIKVVAMVTVVVVAVLEVAAVINEVEITLELAAVSVSCSVYVASDGAVDLLTMGALASVLTVVLIGRLFVDILVEMSVNKFAEVMAEVKFAMPSSLEACSC